jgi:hypothetical protein
MAPLAPPFTLVLRDGESVVENHLVTNENQRLFVVTDSCRGLASRGMPDPIGAGFFNPPLGWWVIEIRRVDGSDDQVWMAPDGSVAIRHGECIGVATGVSEGVGTKLKALPLTTSQPLAPTVTTKRAAAVTPAGIPSWLFLLGGAGVLGYVAYRWMKPKEGGMVTKKRKTRKTNKTSKRNPVDKFLLVGAAGVGAYLLYRYFSSTGGAAAEVKTVAAMPMSRKLFEPGRAMLPVGNVQCLAIHFARAQGVASVKIQQLVDGGYVVYGTALPPRSDAGQRVLLVQGTMEQIYDWIDNAAGPTLDEDALAAACPEALKSLKARRA